MPRTFGDGIVHQSHFDFAVAVDTPLPQHGGGKSSPEEKQIGKLIAENLIVDGATLQMGISFSYVVIVKISNMYFAFNF